MKNENLKIPKICEETEILIDEYLDGMISLKDKEKMDEHIAVCANCSAYLKDTSELIKNINAAQSDEEILSAEKKNMLWQNVESKIDKTKYTGSSSVKPALTYTENQENENFIYRYRFIFSGIAAVIVIAFIVFGVKSLKTGTDRMTEQTAFGLSNYWKVSTIQGNPMIGDVAMSSSDSIKEGQWIQTNSTSRAELIVANIGKVIIEPNSKVIFIKSADGNNRIQVEYGTINTDMKSNTKSFFVEMPSAVATDNGGSYSMTVDSTGDGLVFVKSGKVEVQSPGKEVIIPAGNLVLTKKNIGVGTPFNENSSAKFKSALFNFDFGQCIGTCVATLLDNAKMSDAVTLVNMLPNLDKEYSEKVYAKVANFVSPPVPPKTDSSYFLDEENLNIWIDKIQTEVQVNVENSMKNLEKSLESLKELEKINPEAEKELENFAKNWKFQIKTSDKGNYVWKQDSLSFDKEQFKLDMEEMKKDINESNRENKEQLKEDMQQLKEDLKEMQKELKENLNLNNEQLKKELERANQEIKKAMKEVEKLNISDSVKSKTKVKIKSPEGFDEPDVEVDTDEPEEDNK